MVPIALVPHRAPVPKEMLKAAGLKGQEQLGRADTSSPSLASAAKPSAPAPEESTKILVGAAVVGVVLLGGLALLGWRLVYNRPIRRRRPPSPPSK
jgi:hypothetical protein